MNNSSTDNLVDLDLSFSKGRGSDIIAISNRITKLKNYFKNNKKDYRVARTIVVLAQRRKKLINYLGSRDKDFCDSILKRISNN